MRYVRYCLVVVFVVDGIKSLVKVRLFLPLSIPDE